MSHLGSLRCVPSPPGSARKPHGGGLFLTLFPSHPLGLMPSCKTPHPTRRPGLCDMGHVVIWRASSRLLCRPSAGSGVGVGAGMLQQTAESRRWKGQGFPRSPPCGLRTRLQTLCECVLTSPAGEAVLLLVPPQQGSGDSWGANLGESGRNLRLPCPMAPRMEAST